MKIIIFLYPKDISNFSSQIYKLSETSFLIGETTYEIIETNYKKKQALSTSLLGIKKILEPNNQDFFTLKFFLKTL